MLARMREKPKNVRRKFESLAKYKQRKKSNVS